MSSLATHLSALIYIHTNPFCIESLVHNIVVIITTINVFPHRLRLLLSQLGVAVRLLPLLLDDA